MQISGCKFITIRLHVFSQLKQLPIPFLGPLPLKPLLACDIQAYYYIFTVSTLSWFLVKCNWWKISQIELYWWIDYTSLTCTPELSPTVINCTGWQKTSTRKIRQTNNESLSFVVSVFDKLNWRTCKSTMLFIYSQTCIKADTLGECSSEDQCLFLK